MTSQAVLNSVSGKLSLPVVSTSSFNSLQVERASVRFFCGGSMLRSQCIFSSCFCVPKRSWQYRNPSTRFQTRAFQAATADGDSSNGDGVGSSNHAMDLSSIWSRQDVLRPFVASSLQGLREGLTSLKQRGLQSSQDGFGKAYSRIKTANGRSLFENVRWSDLAAQGGKTWQNIDPWIKWPLAIFAGAYVAVWASCGLEVAVDLVPLWIIGPLITGSMIRSAYFVAELTRKGITSTKPLRQAAMRASSQFLEDARNGELVDKLRSSIEQKNTAWKEEIEKKRADFVIYVKSGQAASDFKVFLLIKFSQLNDWSTESYENFADWARPYWRAFSRLMKKLF